MLPDTWTDMITHIGIQHINFKQRPLWQWYSNFLGSRNSYIINKATVSQKLRISNRFKTFITDLRLDFLFCLQYLLWHKYERSADDLPALTVTPELHFHSPPGHIDSSAAHTGRSFRRVEGWWETCWRQHSTDSLTRRHKNLQPRYAAYGVWR